MGVGYFADIAAKSPATCNPHDIFLACFDGELWKQLSSSRPPTISDAEPLFCEDACHNVAGQNLLMPDSNLSRSDGVFKVSESRFFGKVDSAEFVATNF
jgi:hypothetical protein